MYFFFKSNWTKIEKIAFKVGRLHDWNDVFEIFDGADPSISGPRELWRRQIFPCALYKSLKF